MVLVTNALAVQVPMQMARGLDHLRSGAPDVGRSAAIIAVLGVLIIVTRTLSRAWFFTPGRLVEFNLREDLFAHCLRLQPNFHAGITTGDLLSRTTGDVTFARAFAGFALLQVINVVGAIGLSLGQMLTLSVPLTLLCALPVALAAFAVQAGIGRMFNLQRAAQVQLATLSDDLLGALQGVATIQAFCVEEVFVDRLKARSAALRATNIAMARLRALVFPLLTVASGASVFVLIAVGGPMALAGTITAGELAAFIALVGYMLVPLRLLGVLFPVFQRAEASLERVHAVLDAVPDRPESRGPVALPRPGCGPAIELRGLCFAWPDAPDRPVLQDITLSIAAGSTVGIYGPTGSGKTTLLRILARLQNPAPGMVRVDGADLTSLDLDEWRRHLTYVPQTPFLFSETIRENVGFGIPLDRVRDAVRAAALEVDLGHLPDGLETVVGERGIVLSGGQRQRVALARGLVRDTELVLLDDVLSAVDHHTEQELIAMLRARGERPDPPTRIIVSHRLSALEQADVVLVLAEGRLVASGPHAALLEQPGPYRDAWLAQRGAA